jgi:acetoin utilization protein AcuB
MNDLSPVKDIMTSDLITVNPGSSISDVEDIFSKNRIHHIPVTEGKKLVGIISKSDYLFFKRGYNDLAIEDAYDEKRTNRETASSIMTKGLAVLESNDRIGVAIEIFKENLFHAIPIVDDEELKGIITTFDLIDKYIPSLS